jgi:hypothetical protein
VQSSSLEKQKAKTLERRLNRQKEGLGKEARELAAKACDADAQSALDELLSRAAALGFQVQGNTVKEESFLFLYVAIVLTYTL